MYRSPLCNPLKLNDNLYTYLIISISHMHFPFCQYIMHTHATTYVRTYYTEGIGLLHYCSWLSLCYLLNHFCLCRYPLPCLFTLFSLCHQCAHVCGTRLCLIACLRTSSFVKLGGVIVNSKWLSKMSNVKWHDIIHWAIS